MGLSQSWWRTGETETETGIETEIGTTGGRETETERGPGGETGTEIETERETGTETRTVIGTVTGTGQTEIVTVTAAATAPAKRAAAPAAAAGGAVMTIYLLGMAAHPSSPWRPPARLGQGLAPWALALDLGGLCGVQLEDQWGR